MALESAASTVTIDQILTVANQSGASDVHITVGIPPKMRVSGHLQEMNFPRLLPDDTQRLLYGIMNEKQKQAFDDKGEWDFSYSISSSATATTISTRILSRPMTASSSDRCMVIT